MIHFKINKYTIGVFLGLSLILWAFLKADSKKIKPTYKDTEEITYKSPIFYKPKLKAKYKAPTQTQSFSGLAQSIKKIKESNLIGEDQSSSEVAQAATPQQSAVTNTDADSKNKESEKEDEEEKKKKAEAEEEEKKKKTEQAKLSEKKQQQAFTEDSQLESLELSSNEKEIKTQKDSSTSSYTVYTNSASSQQNTQNIEEEKKPKQQPQADVATVQKSNLSTEQVISALAKNRDMDSLKTLLENEDPSQKIAPMVYQSLLTEMLNTQSDADFNNLYLFAVKHFSTAKHLKVVAESLNEKDLDIKAHQISSSIIHKSIESFTSTEQLQGFKETFSPDFMAQLNPRSEATTEIESLIVSLSFAIQTKFTELTSDEVNISSM